jgi:hypothetical protein
MYHQISLFTADLIQGLGHGISLKWVIEGGLNVGTFCTVQGMLIMSSKIQYLTILPGVLRQLGDLSIALCTMVSGFIS